MGGYIFSGDLKKKNANPPPPQLNEEKNAEPPYGMKTKMTNHPKLPYNLRPVIKVQIRFMMGILLFSANLADRIGEIEIERFLFLSAASGSQM